MAKKKEKLDIKEPELMRVEISKIRVKQNFRKKFEIDALKKNMAERGLIQPIVVTADFILVAGERRLRSAKALGWTEIDCVVRHYPNALERMADGVFENHKRAELSPSENMESLAWLKNTWEEKREIRTQGGHNRVRQEDAPEHSFAERVSKELNMGKKTVERKVRIGKKLTPKLAEALNTKKITEKQAEQVVRIPDKKTRDSILDEVIGTTLIETKEIIDRVEAETRAKPRKVPKDAIDGKSPDVWLRGAIKSMEHTSKLIDQAMGLKAWENAKRNREPFLDQLFQFQQWARKFNTNMRKVKR